AVRVAFERSVTNSRIEEAGRIFKERLPTDRRVGGAGRIRAESVNAKCGVEVAHRVAWECPSAIACVRIWSRLYRRRQYQTAKHQCAGDEKRWTYPFELILLIHRWFLSLPRLLFGFSDCGSKGSKGICGEVPAPASH